jgi:protoporphyrinogen IX oxidase
VFKNTLPTSGTAWLIFGMCVAMAAIIQLYARKRRLDREKQALPATDAPSEVSA